VCFIVVQVVDAQEGEARLAMEDEARDSELSSNFMSPWVVDSDDHAARRE